MSPERFTSTTELVAELFSRYKSVMIHVAVGILKDKQLAEDTASEAMIKIIKNIHLIDDIESRRCANFVYTITKNTALDMLRKKKKETKMNFLKHVTKHLLDSFI